MKERISRRLSVLACLAFAAFAFLSVFCPADAFARTKIQSGEVSAVTTANPITVTLPEAVDKSRAFIVFTYYTNTASPASDLFAARFDPTDGTNRIIQFQRNTADSSSARQMIRYSVIESDMFEVEYKETVFGSNVTSQTVALSGDIDFTAGKTFAISRATKVNTTTANYIIHGLFTTQVVYNDSPTADQLIISRYASGTVNETACEVWTFVVKLKDDSTVQYGSLTAASTDFMVTGSLSNEVDRSKSFLVFGMTNSDYSCDQQWRGSIVSDMSVGFNKRSSGGSTTIYYYCVELGTLGSAENGAATINATSDALYNENFNLSETYDADWRFALLSLDSSGTSSAPDRFMAAIDFPSTTAVRVSKGDNSYTSVIDYFAVLLEPMKVISPNTAVTWKCGESQEISWYAPSSISTVNIYLSNDGGSTYPITVATGVTNSSSGTSTYNWTPSASDGTVIGTTMKIKVVDQAFITAGGGPTDAACKYSSDASDVNFEIMGKLELTGTANGGTVTYSDSFPITWTYYGNTSNPAKTLTIKYDTNSGSGGYTNTIATGVAAGDGTYPLNWGTNPLPLSNTIKIRIEQDSPTGYTNKVYAESVSNITVNGSITLVEPNSSGITWNSGDTKYVQWTYKGDEDFRTKGVNIKLSRDNGDTWPVEIAASAVCNYKDNTSDTNYNKSWVVLPPVTGTATAKVKITSNEYPEITDQSENAFTIGGSLDVTYPNTNVAWEAGASQTITWNYTGDNIGTVNVKLSRNSGGTWETLASGVALGTGGTGSWTWNPVTAPAGTTNLVKIESAKEVGGVKFNDYIYDQSEEAFEIRQVITVGRPNTALVFRSGTNEQIGWTVNGTVEKFEVLYSKNGTDWTLITPAGEGTTGAEAGSYPYNWTWTNIPDDLSDTVKIRVRDFSRPTVILDDSDVNFKIKGDISVTSPGGEAGSVLYVGVPVTITWNVTGSVGSLASPKTVNVRLSMNGGTSYPTLIGTKQITGAGTYSLSWTPTAAQMGTTNKIMVGLDGDEDLVLGTAGASEYNFSVEPKLTLLYPNTANLSFQIGDTAYIKWTPNPVDFGTVELKYDTNSGKGDDGILGTSDDYQGTINTVSVNSNNVPSGETDIGYKWTIPDVAGIVGTKLRVKVYQTGKASAVYAASDFDFTVKGTLDLTGAADGTGSPVWGIGETKQITWNAVGDIGSVALKYAEDGETFAPVLDSGSDPVTVNCAGTGSYSYDWLIPNSVISTDKKTGVKFRVESVSDPNNINSVSTGTITIKKRYLNVAVPSSILYVGDNDVALTNISWDTKGIVPPPSTIQVKLAYDLGTNTFPYNINDGNPTPDSAGWVWDVPADAIGDTVKVRVMSASSPEDVYGDSEPFTVKGKILPVFPTASDTLIVGNPVSGGVQYEKKGNIGNLKIEYIHNGYSTEITPVGGTDEGTSFAWTVAATDSNGGNVIDASGSKNSKFKFTSLGDLPVTKESANFQIRGEIYDVEPYNGLPLPMGSTQLIKWKTRGNVGNVRIRLDLYDGNGPDGTANTGDEFTNAVYAPDDVTSGESVAYTQGTDGWSWKVPNLPSTQARIRVESISNPYDYTNPTKAMATYAVSQGAALYLRGAINSVTAQDTPWKNGDTNKLIDWTTTGTVGAVDITLYYDHNDDGPPWNHIHSYSIVTNTATQPYPWPLIPDTVTSEHAVVKVTSHSDSMVTNTSAEFKIKPVLSAAASPSPSVTSEWEVGTKPVISWAEPKGDVTNVKIQISTDGTTWSDTNPPTLASKGGLIVDSTLAATLKYEDWTVADLMSKTCVIRVSKVGDPEVYFNTVPFNIKGVIGVTGPNGADLPVGNNTPKKTISWTYKGSLGTADLWYCIDGDQSTPTWQQISGGQGISIGTDGVGSFEWDPIPATPSANVKVKVESSFNSGWKTVSGVSSTNGIIGSIQLNHPNIGETMEVGSSKTIEWVQQGGITNFAIYYKYDGGSWIEISPPGGIPGTDEGSGKKSWSWTVADHISNNVLFKVVDYGNQSKVAAESTGPNTIKGTLTLTAPSGGTYTIGNAIPITWNKLGTIGAIKIEYSAKGDFTDSVPIESSYASGSDGAVTYGGGWTAPFKVAETYKVRVSTTSSPEGCELTSQSASAFAVRPVISSISSPVAGDEWNVGIADKKITWVAVSATKPDATYPKVKIEYSVDGGAYTAISGAESLDCVNSTNNFTWSAGIPDEKSNSVKVKVTFIDYASVNLESGVFKILPKITVPALSPSILTVGQTYNNLIKWSSTGTKISNVKVIYNTGSGYTDPDNVIATAAVGDGAAGINWTIPNTITLTDTASIKVMDTGTGFSAVYGETASTFQLKGGLTLTTPSSSTSWTASTTQTIAWTFKGSIANVNVYYDLDNATDEWTLISPVSSKAQSGSSGSSTISWDLPSIVTNKARIKIEDAADTTVTSVSELFKIGAEFLVGSPINGTPVYAEDTGTSITWSTTKGTAISKVHLYYSNNSEDATPTWIKITPAGGTGNTGSYPWNPVPGALADISATTHRIKVTQYDPDNETNSYSIGTGTTFPILCKLAVTSPAAGDSWKVGETRTVKFTKKGAVQSVDVYYSYDGADANYTKLNTVSVDVSGDPDVNGEYSYSWTIPAATSLTTGNAGKIKVKAVSPTTQNNVLVDGVSGGFQVKGGITLVSPDTGESMVVGGTKTIEWTPLGNIALFKIEYKYDTSDWTEISTSGGVAGTVNGSNRTWTWPTVLDHVSNSVYFRVSDYNNSNVVATSSGANMIKGTLTLTAPSGGTYTIGNAIPITWNKLGTIGAIKIEYSAKGDFTDSVPIESSYASGSDGAVTYGGGWTAPFKVAETYKVRVSTTSSPEGCELTSQSASAFAVRPVISSISSPVAGDEWNVGIADKKITWVAVSATKPDATYPKVKIEYSVDGGAYTAISGAESLDCVNSTNNFTWSAGIPDEKSNSVKVKVTFIDYASVNLESGVFKILPKITVPALSPSILTVGQTYNNLIKWSSTGTKISNVKVIYNTGSGYTDPDNVIATAAVGDGAAGINWTIPNTITLTDTASIKVMDTGTGFSAVYGETASTFQLKGGLTLTTPSSSTSWTASTTQTIAWTFKGSIANVNVYYDLDNATDEWTLISPVSSKAQSGSSGSSTISWDLPSIVTNKARIKIEDAADTTVYSISSDFKVKGEIALGTVTSPLICSDPGTDPTSVTWVWNKGTGINNVRVEFYDGVSWSTLDPSFTNSGNYIFNVPETTSRTNCKVRIRSSNPDQTDIEELNQESNEFWIHGKVDVSAPVSGASWTSGIAQDIVFTVTGKLTTDETDKVNILYAKNGTSFDYTIASNLAVTPGENTYSWTPNPTHDIFAAGVGKIKVVSATYQTVYGTSAAFSLGKISVTQPDGTVPWVIKKSSTYSAQWSAQGVDNVNVYYSTLDGAVGSYSLIGSALASTGSLTWPQTPDAVSNSCRVKVINANEAVDTAVIAGVSGVFKLVEEFSSVSPHGGTGGTDPLTANDATTITWNKLGDSLAKVKLYLSTDNGVNYSLIKETDNTASASWNVPATVRSTLCKLKVVSSINDANFAVSDGVFTIKNRLGITYPKVGTVPWNVGSSYTIQWTYEGPNVDPADGVTPIKVKIQYAPDGTTFSTIPNAGDVSIGTGGAGSWSWTIADDTALTTTGKIKVTDTGIDSAAAISSGTLTIRGDVMPDEIATSPLFIDDPLTITWTLHGEVTQVNIYYSTNGITGPWISIASAWDATQPYTAFVVPEAVTDAFRIKVEDANNTSVSNITQNDVQIVGKIELKTPNTLESDWVVGGNKRNIKFRPVGQFAVRIEGSTDDFATTGNTWEFAVIPADQITSRADNTFQYDVPDRLSDTVKVRVSDADEAKAALVTDKSESTFRIIGALTVTKPTSTDVLQIDKPFTLEWQRKGSIPTVDIYYSTNGTNWTSIVAGYANTGEYTTRSWTPVDANAVTSHAYIKVCDSGHQDVVLDTSDAFVIKGWFEFAAGNSPALNEIWRVGEQHTITWTKHGNIPNVKIEYTPDSQNYYTAVASTANSGSCYWTPDPSTTLLSAVAQLRISDVEDATNMSLASPIFKLGGIVTLISPSPTVGNQKYIVDSTQTITWKVTGKIDNVRLDYSTDGTNFTEVVKDSTPSGNGAETSYTWAVGDTPSPTVVVRVSDVKDSSAYAVSAVDKIQCSFNVTSPATGYSWAVDSLQNLIWTATHGTCPFVKIELYNGTAWETDPIFASTINPPDGGALSWKVLDRINTACKIRVSDTRDPDAKAESGAFRIRAGLAMTYPNGGENLNVNTQPNITWEKHGTVSTVKLEYSIDDGVTYPATLPNNPIATGVDVTGCTTDCSYPWTIPDALSAKVRVKVSNENSNDPFSDESNAVNTIRGVLTLTSFTAGEIVKVGQVKLVEWSKVGSVDYVKLEYSVNNGAYQAIPGAESLDSSGATGSYEWTPADSIAISDNIKVRISSADETNQPALAGISPRFEIQPTLTFTQVPAVNEVVTVDSANTLKWTKTGTINTVKIQIKVGEAAYQTITGASSIDVTGASPYSYSWTVPPSISSSVSLKVVSNADADVYSESPVFKIAAGVFLENPNGGAYYEVDNPCLIRWSTTGTIANVSFYYDTNSGKGADGIADTADDYPNFIVTRPAGDLSYSWTTPDKIGNKLRIKMVNADENNYTPADTSDANFEIRGRIDIDSPVGGEVWKITSLHDVQWHKHGTMPTVKVEYSTNAGAYAYCKDSSNMSADSVSGNSFSWKIPDSKALNGARVKVSNLADPTNVYTETPAFTIRGGFEWLYPVTAGKVFKVGTTETLRWLTLGTLTSISLEYSVNGVTFQPMLKADGSEATAISNTGSFNWVIPDNISKTVVLRIRDSSDADAVEDSVQVKIAGVIYIDTPTSLVRWGVGSDKDITWHMDGNIANLKIEYSINGGTDWIDPPISDNIVGSLGVKQWKNIPNTCTANAVIRISDAIADSGTDAVISPVFKIVGSFAFTSPTSASIWPVTTGEIANSQQTISWATQGVISQVNLYYSSTGAAPWTLINTGGPISDNGQGGNYLWTVPDSISTSCKIRIEDKDDELTYAESPAFTISGDLALTAPVAGNKWAAGTTKMIMWSRNGSISKVNLEYYDGVAWQTIIDPNTSSADITNSGSFNWAIPADMLLTDMARVRIKSVGNPVITRTSGVFKVMGGFDVTYPKGGESILVNTTPTITWTSTSSRVDMVRIDYSIDGGTTFPESQVITLSTANTGSFLWSTGVPPEAVSKLARIRVSDTTDTADAFGVSKNNFYIRAIFTITEPNGYDSSDPKYPLNWVIGRENTIKWICVGSLSNVKLEFTRYGNFNIDKQNIGTVDGIVPNNPVNGVSSYIWTIPDNNASNNVLVRVSDPNDSEANDVSDYNFRIIPGFAVTSPNTGSESWAVKSSHEITWSSTSSIANVPEVQISYSKDGGATFPASQIITTTVNDGAYTWSNIPDSITTEARIKVADASDSTAYDISDANFSIRADLDLTAPDGGSGQTFVVGEAYTISWTCQGTVEKVNLDYTTDGSNWSAIAAAVDNNNVLKGGSLAWPNGVVDAISSTVKVRVSDADSGHPGSSSVSADNFRIKGALALTAPVSASVCEVDKDFNILWDTTGAIQNVQLRYSIDGSTFPDSQIIGTFANTGADRGNHTWRIPNPATPNAIIRITDASSGNSDVTDDSEVFHTRVYFELTSPNTGSEVWKVGETRNITWKWGGEKSNVKLSYSVTGENGPWIEISPSAVVPNGAGGSGTYSYAWTVESAAVSKQVRFKIEDPDDPTVSDISDNNFTVQGVLTLGAPNGSERWITRENKAITWTSAGNVPFVKLEYYLDNDYAGTKKTIAESVANVPGSNSYAWYVPNIKNSLDAVIHPTTVRVRVSDANDPAAYDDSNSAFTVDYYSVTWEVKDMISGQHLTQLSVNGASDQIDPDSGEADAWKTSTMPDLPTVPLGSPVTMKLPAGFWSILWTKSGYGDKQSIFNLNRDMTLADGDSWKADGSGLLFMETTAIHIWEADSDFAYDPANLLLGKHDTLTVSSWLQRDGFVVSGGIKADIYIYDEGELIKHLEAPGAAAIGTNPDSAGFFHMVWESTSLESGKVYTVITDITNASGAHFKTPSSFSVTEAVKLQETQDTVNSVLDKSISEVETNIAEMITGSGATPEDLIAAGGMKGVVETRLDEQTNLIVGGKSKEEILAAGGMVGMLQASLTSFETKSADAITKLQAGADQAVTAGENLEATAKKFSWGASAAPDPALSGDTITLQVQGQPNLLPKLDIYSWDNKAIYSDVIMSQNRPGFYVFSFIADNNFAVGKAYTYLVSEQTTGGLVSGSGMVESMGISTVAGLAAAAPEAERAAKKALDAIKAVEAVLVSKDNINIALTLQNLKTSIEALPETLNKQGPNTQLTNAVNQISEQLKSFVGAEGVDLSTLLDQKLGDTSTIKEMRNKTDTINAVVDILLKIMESKFGGVDAPIVATSLQSGSVKFRIVVINPSKTKVQKVQVKKFLPTEVKLKDIMDAGGLDLEYDSEKSIYYAYKNDLELQPGESRVFEVEVEDIWLIPASKLEDLKKQVADISPRMAKTEYAARAQELANTVPAVIDEIARNQVDDTVSREQHIGLYRQNLQTIKRIDDELASLLKLIQPQSGMSAPEVLEKSRLKINMPAKTTTWLIIIIIIIFLGLLAVVFFFGWQAQMRASQDALGAMRDNAFPDQKSADKTGQNQGTAAKK